MHGALVAIGTRSGAVYIYHLEGDWKEQVRTSRFFYHRTHFLYPKILISDSKGIPDHTKMAQPDP